MDKIFNILNVLRPEFDYHASKDFIQDGLLDSFDIIALISELEGQFDIMIDALDILPENFCTAQAIAEIVKKNGGQL